MIISKVIIDDDLVKRVCRARSRGHQAAGHSRPLSQKYEYVGLMGEIAVAQYLDLPVDLRINGDQSGDPGYDLVCGIGTIDVKTAQKPLFLLVEVGKVTADFFVLAGFQDDKATPLGWATAADVNQAPTRQFTPGIESHHIPQSDLRPMRDLLRAVISERRDPIDYDEAYISLHNLWNR